MKLGGIVPAFFMGSPLALVLGGVLFHFMPAAAALTLGAVAGTLVGRALLKAI